MAAQMTGNCDDLPRPPEHLHDFPFIHRQKVKHPAISAIIHSHSPTGWRFRDNDDTDRVRMPSGRWLTY
ncbi:hypothetical protein [Pandoraea sputorum]|uniref:hypothetical protein n=1 Tax=Pandoraea sputorum TaxID=93222 RepID=UPI001782E532|nr:hypothetical protein [Pandoraea sputorum]